MAKKILLVTLILIIGFCGLVYCQEIKNDGIHKTYYPNGQVKTEENYKNGLRNGVAKIYDENGRVVTTAKFKNDELVKAWANEPERAFGKLSFLLRLEFLGSVIIISLLLSFIWVKRVFKNRPL